MSYVAQLLPDRDGANALRKLMNAALNAYEDGSNTPITLPGMTVGELDSLYELYANLTRDMRRRTG